MTRHELRTPRLLLRRWRDDDLAPFAAMNADPEVMRWFPAPLDRAGSDAMVARVEAHHDEHGYGLWAVEVLESARGAAPFVGFVGLQQPAAFDPPFPHADPLVEVGWRLDRDWWGLGIATEAAAECLRFAFDDVGLPEVDSWTVPANIASQAVMQRLGMRYDGVFAHPRGAGEWWGPHVLYRADVDSRRAPAEASGRTSP
jgi:ribosomal-protein-alanine N-acetyltransferase